MSSSNELFSTRINRDDQNHLAQSIVCESGTGVHFNCHIEHSSAAANLEMQRKETRLRSAQTHDPQWPCDVENPLTDRQGGRSDHLAARELQGKNGPPSQTSRFNHLMEIGRGKETARSPITVLNPGTTHMQLRSDPMKGNGKKSATATLKAPVPAPTRIPQAETAEKFCPHGGVALEEAIRVRAYQKWERAGRPPGNGVSFWVEAEAELKACQ